MNGLRTGGVHNLLRRAGQMLAALGLFVLLASCAGGGGASKPFAKVDGSPNGKPAPPITLVSVSGLPDDKMRTFREALSASAGKRDIAIVEGAFDSGTFGLSGSFALRPAGGEVDLAYNWTLTDKAGTVLHTIVADERAPATGADAWTAITPLVLGRAAAYTAESLSSRLAQLGYATQVGGIPPPVDAFAMAMPGAENDIDYETLLGPGRGDPSVMAAANPPADPHVQRIGPEEPVHDIAMAGAEAEDAQAGKAEAEKAAKADYQIKAVAVMPVKGSPGDGNAQLTEAMRQTLRLAGWPVISAPRADALTIGGKVKLDDAGGNAQRVSLAWTISAPNGKVLGTISQSNTVPTGSIDLGWGDTAVQVAEAAALGIFDLVKKLR